MFVHSPTCTSLGVSCQIGVIQRPSGCQPPYDTLTVSLRNPVPKVDEFWVEKGGSFLFCDHLYSFAFLMFSEHLPHHEVWEGESWKSKLVDVINNFLDLTKKAKSASRGGRCMISSPSHRLKLISSFSFLLPIEWYLHDVFALCPQLKLIWTCRHWAALDKSCHLHGTLLSQHSRSASKAPPHSMHKTHYQSQFW